MSINSNVANREVCDLVWLNYKTKKPELFMDFANTTSPELTADTVYAYGGKGHPKRVAFDGNKGGTLTVETQMQSFQLWQMMTGGVVKTSAEYYTHEYFTIGDEAKVTLATTPMSGTVVAFKRGDDGGATLEVTGTDKEITVTGATKGDEISVYYAKQAKENSKILHLDGDTFPHDYVVYGDTVQKSEEDELLPYRITYYRVHPQPNMSLSFANDGDPVTVTITCDLMVDKDNNFMDMILEEED